jgi:hypothetical protein
MLTRCLAKAALVSRYLPHWEAGQWIAYNEAGYRPILQQNPTATISGAGNLAATVTASLPGIFHVILAVTDNGTPNLTSYRRTILNVTQ